MSFQILSDLGSESRRRQRPPGALAQVLPADTCTGCGDCVMVCPEMCMSGAVEFTRATRAGLARVLAAEAATPCA